MAVFAERSIAAEGQDRCQQQRPNVQAQLATVGCVLGQQGTVKCLGSDTLADAADLLMESDRSATAVLDEDGTLLGALTENDIAQAYAEGKCTHTVTANEWLLGGRSRFSCSLSEELTVTLTTPLHKAAEKLRAVHNSFSETSFRHLIVKDGEGKLQGILSALDLARALGSTSAGMAEVESRVGTTPVEQIMKPQARLPTCESTATMAQVIKSMLRDQQNCVLITEDTEGVRELLGMFTTRDALRAFAEHTRLDVPIGRWIRGLQSSLGLRMVGHDTSMVKAAWLMAAHSIHHLVVLSSEELAGVVSSADLARAIGSAERTVRSNGPNDA